MLDRLNLDVCRRVAEDAARSGGAELLSWQGRFSSREKARADLVTDADLASQEAVRRIIVEHFADHAFIGEESPPSQWPANDELAWIVDPLDGTTNYVHGFPQYAVSVALTHGSDVLVGVIYDPTTDECYSAIRGAGAWCNQVAISTSEIETASTALVAVSLPAHVTDESPDLAGFIEAARFCQAVRRTGSAALNLAYVARGYLDAFWATHIHPWDVAAGVLLVREAGGTLTSRDGGAFNLWRPHFLSSATEALHRELVARLPPFHSTPSASGR